MTLQSSWFQKHKPGPVADSLFMLPMDMDVDLSATMFVYVLLCSLS